MSIVGAVSPPGGDFSDPVTSATLGIVQVCKSKSILASNLNRSDPYHTEALLSLRRIKSFVFARLASH